MTADKDWSDGFRSITPPHYFPGELKPAIPRRDVDGGDMLFVLVEV